MVNATTQMMMFQRAQYCPAPPGDSITRKSLFDSLVSGCVPVLFAKASLRQYLWFFNESEVSDGDDRFSLFLMRNEYVVGESIHTSRCCTLYGPVASSTFLLLVLLCYSQLCLFLPHLCLTRSRRCRCSSRSSRSKKAASTFSKCCEASRPLSCYASNEPSQG